MSLNNLVKRLQDIMRNDAGINGDAQRIEQMVWILFLKVYDAKEETWEIYDDRYRSIIPEHLRWRHWAVDRKDGKEVGVHFHGHGEQCDASPVPGLHPGGEGQ